MGSGHPNPQSGTTVGASSALKQQCIGRVGSLEERRTEETRIGPEFLGRALGRERSSNMIKLCLLYRDTVVTKLGLDVGEPGLTV